MNRPNLMTVKKVIMAPELMKGFGTALITAFLIYAAALTAQASVPPELDLQIVTAPDYQSVPCPIKHQNQEQASGTDNSSGSIDHAAHHRIGGTETSISDPLPVPEQTAAPADNITQLLQSIGS